MGPDTANRTEVLFPEIDPYATGRLAVDARHTLYWETCGNPNGVPLVFLHGGPGGASLPHHRRYYDPSFWRIVLFDQRGAGRSTPPADLTDNTTQHLVADVERLREHLLIEEHDPPERRIVVAPMVRQRRTAGAAMQEDERHAVGIPARLPV